jgi:hypothetical protein
MADNGECDTCSQGSGANAGGKAMPLSVADAARDLWSREVTATPWPPSLRALQAGLAGQVVSAAIQPTALAPGTDPAGHDPAESGTPRRLPPPAEGPKQPARPGLAVSYLPAPWEQPEQRPWSFDRRAGQGFAASAMQVPPGPGGVEYLSWFPGNGSPWVEGQIADPLEAEMGDANDTKAKLERLRWLDPRARRFVGRYTFKPLKFRDLLVVLRILQAAFDSPAIPSSELGSEEIRRRAGGQSWPNQVVSLACSERRRYHHTTTLPIEVDFPLRPDETVCCYEQYYGRTPKDPVTGKTLTEEMMRIAERCEEQVATEARKHADEISKLQTRFSGKGLNSVVGLFEWLFDTHGIPTKTLLDYLDEQTRNCQCPPHCQKRLRIIEYRAISQSEIEEYIPRFAISATRITREHRQKRFSETITVPLIGVDGKPVRDNHGNIRTRQELEQWTTAYDEVCISTGVYFQVRILAVINFEISCDVIDVTQLPNITGALKKAARALAKARPPWS